MLARTVPGYSESSQAMNTIGETLRGRIALRLFDGIPQSTPLRDGSRNGAFTDMGPSGRIEVINGPSAAEGIGAAGGIINYISKAPTEDGTNITLTTRLTSQFDNDSESWKVGRQRRPQGRTTSTCSWPGSFVGPRHHLRRRRPPHRPERQRLGRGLRDEELLPQGRHQFRRRRRAAPAVLGQLLQAQGKGNYFRVDGGRALGISDTAEPGPPLGTGNMSLAGPSSTTSSNRRSLSAQRLVRRHLSVDALQRRPGDALPRRQRRRPAGSADRAARHAGRPVGDRLQEEGRAHFVDAAGHLRCDGLELHVGVDLVEDETQQRLALTDRIWVPPMDYTSTAPYAAAVLRHRPGDVRAAACAARTASSRWTTTPPRSSATARFVEGGTLEYKENLPNFGAVWRIGGGWSVFGSYGKGFTLPNVGIPLRNVNVPGQSVEGILDLQAIVFDNKGSRLQLARRDGRASARPTTSRSRTSARR